jgi:osmotically-inducible protein OsmY
MRIAAAIFVLALLAAACLAAQPSDDDRIYDQVRLRLAGDRDVKGGALEVKVEQGVVTLRGKVRELKQKEKAERLTRKIKGVKKVVNELEVETTPPARSRGET